VWNNAKDRDVAQAREELKKAIENVKNCGLLQGPPVTLSITVRLEMTPNAAKKVTANAHFAHTLRVKVKEGKLEEFAQAAVKSGLPYLNNEHVIRYLGGTDAKENCWIGIAYLGSQEDVTAIQNSPERLKYMESVRHLMDGEPQLMLFNLKHSWESPH